MNNSEVARLLRDIAAIYTIKDSQKYFFQILAYQRAAETIENSSSEIKDLYNEGKLKDLPGVGPTILSYLEEMVKTGKVTHFEQIRKEVPEAFFPLLLISGIGPKTAFKLVSVLHINNKDQAINELEKRAICGDIAKLEGFGLKKEQQILQAIREYRHGKMKSIRMLLPFADSIAEKIISHLKKCKEVLYIEALGSLRRRIPTIGDVDIAVASKNPKSVIAWFTKYPYKERIIEAGSSSSSLLTSGGKQVDLMVQSPWCFGALLQHFTGSKAHNIHLRTYAQSMGLSLSERGIKTKQNVKNKYLTTRNYNKELGLFEFEKEEDFYNCLGMQWIPPEIREDSGEIELAIQHKLPKLIELSDIKGDLHTHSSFNIEPSHDLGINSVIEMQKKAESLKYEYLGFAEHNPSSNNHNQYQYSRLINARNDLIEQCNNSIKSVQLIKLLEVDIKPDGRLSIDDDCANLLDGMIVSVHSSFSLPKSAMTKRIIGGLSHRKARILGHPTGRLINQRASFEADWNEIFHFCKNNNKAIEINASPSRLDPPEYLTREALEIGVKIVINTDSHAVDQMDLMKYGVMMARRGWVKKEDVVNTLSFNDLIKWLRDK